jgi:hypothetical protein
MENVIGNIRGKTLKNAIFWDVRLCGSCKNRRFGGTQRLPGGGGAKFL